MIVSGLEGVMSTKEKILDAALTLFAENGIVNCNIIYLLSRSGNSDPRSICHAIHSGKGKETKTVEENRKA